ncbi:uracil-DNA glycosylase family protein [Prevotella sp. HMSC073D09]|uniref:uracil-DNA glycosylase family protein n=1 Tax=Prevotella sp. HMSC073D09 TaxID=1739459 RepID=UPI000B144336|nr:uracil-DNA glycosylase family protein [Prevotella sp. HMSC073D09]
MVERHPLKPFLPNGCKLLMLGSFPPSQKRWCMNFFYPNFTNDMWRIFGLAFFEDKQHFVDEANKTFKLDELKAFLTAKGVGIYDTATAVNRTTGTAADKDLEVIEPTNLDELLLQVPDCKNVVVTGQLAADVLRAHFNIAEQPKVGAYVPFIFQPDGREMRLYRMPSSSRAYPLKVEKKTEWYKAMFEETL